MEGEGREGVLRKRYYDTSGSEGGEMLVNDYFCFLSLSLDLHLCVVAAMLLLYSALAC